VAFAAGDAGLGGDGSVVDESGLQADCPSCRRLMLAVEGAGVKCRSAVQRRAGFHARFITEHAFRCTRYLALRAR
jgi:hypothetical protein